MRFCRRWSANCGRDWWLIATHLAALFKQNLIVLTQRHAENDGCHVLEAVYPFLAFTSLTTNVKHATDMVSQLFVRNDASAE
nr:hypothetical protein CFP56_76997 [Quercus suber]